MVGLCKSLRPEGIPSTRVWTRYSINRLPTSFRLLAHMF